MIHLLRTILRQSQQEDCSRREIRDGTRTDGRSAENQAKSRQWTGTAPQPSNEGQMKVRDAPRQRTGRCTGSSCRTPALIAQTTIATRRRRGPPGPPPSPLPGISARGQWGASAPAWPTGTAQPPAAAWPPTPHCLIASSTNSRSPSMPRPVAQAWGNPPEGDPDIQAPRT